MENIYTTESLCYTAETKDNIVSQLYFTQGSGVLVSTEKLEDMYWIVMYIP